MRRISSPYADLHGPWIKPEVLARLPQLRHEFDVNRDPLIRLQLEDMAKTEAQRRRESVARASNMVEAEKARPELRRKDEIGEVVDRLVFAARWLEEQRDAAMARAVRSDPANTPTREYIRTLREPNP